MENYIMKFKLFGRNLGEEDPFLLYFEDESSTTTSIKTAISLADKLKKINPNAEYYVETANGYVLYVTE